MRSSLVSVGSIALVSLVAACGGPEGDDEVDCSMVTGTDTFVVGLDKPGAGGTLDFQLMSADPAPPARDDNTWIVQLSSMASGVVGAPIDGATFAVTPFMPEHQHGSPIRVEITPVAGQVGQYTLSPVNMWMPGVWETTIMATSGDTSDKAVYRFCIE
jgi:hypothetical protein